MPNRDQDEGRLFETVSGALRRWLAKAKDKVMAPWRQYKMTPDPAAVFQVQDDWNAEVETILTVIGQISMGAWNEVTDLPPVSRHAFVMAQLAATQNLLVRIPDEVYNLIFAEIADVVNAGDSMERIAERVDAVLTYTGSERWRNRAKVIAVTETTRAYGAGTVAAGLEQSRVTGRRLLKKWRTEHDERVRKSHRDADGQTVDLSSPFQVGGFYLMFPGDPLGPADEVINCRCDAVVVEGGR